MDPWQVPALGRVLQVHPDLLEVVPVQRPELWPGGGEEVQA